MEVWAADYGEKGVVEFEEAIQFEQREDIRDDKKKKAMQVSLPRVLQYHHTRCFLCLKKRAKSSLFYRIRTI